MKRQVSTAQPRGVRGPRGSRVSADDPAMQGLAPASPARTSRTAADASPAAAPTRGQKLALKHEHGAAAHAAHELRIIGGQWRRLRLPVPDSPGLRPTPDRVRETLFNWLGQELTGWTVLDAFAGTGALGFEAASRGAATVQMLERDAALVRGLQASKAKLGANAVAVTQADALAWMKRMPAQFDLVFLDPPFDSGLFEPALAAALPCVVPQGWIYLEAPAEFEAAALAERGLERYRHARAGAVHAHLLRKS
jgi:16S rRNA (guanine(966)-N(2))-methyltransferase RsmD